LGFPEPRRHLRKVFGDPPTGKADWGVVYANGDKGVLAVYSLSASRPLKTANFDARFTGFENSKRISDWKFTAAGQGLLQPGEPPAQREAREDETPREGACGRASWQRDSRAGGSGRSATGKPAVGLISPCA
jgi:hypothetical protein